MERAAEGATYEPCIGIADGVPSGRGMVVPALKATASARELPKGCAAIAETLPVIVVWAACNSGVGCL